MTGSWKIVVSGVTFCAETIGGPKKDIPAATPTTATFCAIRLRDESALSNICTSASHRGQVPLHSPSYVHSGISKSIPFATATARRTDFRHLQMDFPVMAGCIRTYYPLYDNTVLDGDSTVGHLGQLSVVCHHNERLAEAVAEVKEKLVQLAGVFGIKVP